MITSAPSLDLATEAARHAAAIADYLKQVAADSPQAKIALKQGQNIVEWGEENFYIPTDDGQPRLIRFMPHQKVIMALFFEQRCAEYFDCKPNFQTLVYSTVKKSGKTAMAALVARWITETWGSHAEVYALANDLEQARGRIYAAALASIELDPRYARAARGIPDLWRIIEREAAYLPTHSTLKAVSSDYKGEAGSNPVATLWSELWGYSSEASQRLWEELTPVPTRPRSIRYVETYAGYENESGILNDLEDRIKKSGYQVRRHDLDALGLEWPWPDEDPLPFHVHPQSRTMAYWDEGIQARRMPWQTPEYYSAQESELRDQAFKRLHLNYRVSQAEQFIPIEWWDRCRDDKLPALDAKTPVVVGADASVTGDYTALVAVSRRPGHDDEVAQRLCEVWEPSQGNPLDYSKTIEPTLRAWCAKYNVVEVAYDQYQLHDLMTRLRNEGIAWCRPFSQMGDRMKSDKALFDMIRDMRIVHTGDEHLRDGINNCAAKVPPDDNSKLRIVKKAKKSKIDPAVCLSMAAYECLRLNLT